MCGIFTYIYHKSKPNVGHKDPMGISFSSSGAFPGKSKEGWCTPHEASAKQCEHLRTPGFAKTVPTETFCQGTCAKPTPGDSAFICIDPLHVKLAAPSCPK